MKITSVEPQKKEGRYNIFVDENFWCGLSENTLAKFGIYPKREIDGKYLDEVFEYEIFNKLYDGAIGKIGRRPHSQQEMEIYLSQKLWKNKNKWFKDNRYEDEFEVIKERLINEVIKKLVSSKYIDDNDFVRWWIESRNRSKPRGWIALKSELISKGISEKLVNDYRIDNKDERKLAERYYAKISRNKSLSKEKIISRMQSKGFPWEVIKSILPNDEVEFD